VNFELTTQQKSRFRRADRETFVAESHSDAINAAAVVGGGGCGA
jgi:hypothetical protein